MSRGCRGADGNRVAVPVPRVEPLLAGGGGVRARCVSACVRRWEGARRRERGETQPALPTGVTPVRLPNPVLQLCAVLCRRGLGRFSGEVAAVIGPSRSRHVWCDTHVTPMGRSLIAPVVTGLFPVALRHRASLAKCVCKYGDFKNLYRYSKPFSPTVLQSKTFLCIIINKLLMKNKNVCR